MRRILGFLGSVIERSLVPALVSLAIVGVSQAAVWNWSKTASSNASADPTINWAEGMSPSSVNDSARAMMARVAEWRDDTSGLLATAGTADAYTVTTNQGLNATPNDGQLLSVTPNLSNNASATLAADGGTAFPIQTAPGTAIGAAVMVAGTPYALKFNASASAWILSNYFGQPFSVPLGSIVIYSGTSAPNSNFVFAIGQCISRTTYASYFGLVSTTYGACDGINTFGVPDLRERMLAFQGTMGGASSPSRITTAGASCDGTTLATGCGAQNVTLARANLPNDTVSPTVTITDPGHLHGFTVKNNNNNGLLLPRGGDNTSSSATQNTNSATTGITASSSFALNGGVSQTTVNKLPPLLILTALVRIF